MLCATMLCARVDDLLPTMLAYLDPGAGSMILQALAGGVAGAAVVGKLYWARIKRALRLGRSGSAPDQTRR
jgi:hypothetical protein